MESFTDLHVWKQGLLLVKEVYALTKKFPREELYALSAQLRKSSTSILANVAEGFGRYTYPDKAAKYTISRGECAEVKAEIYIAIALNFITEKDAEAALKLTDSVGRMLSGLIQSCRTHTP